MTNYIQNEEKKIITKNLKTKNQIEKLFERIYNYVCKKIKNEFFIKNSLCIIKGRFEGYIKNDKMRASVTLFNALENSTEAFIINPNIEYKIGQTVILGYWDNYNNLILLGIGEKKG